MVSSVTPRPSSPDGAPVAAGGSPFAFSSSEPAQDVARRDRTKQAVATRVSAGRTDMMFPFYPDAAPWVSGMLIEPINRVH
jgi:hypothetical protein